MKKRNNLFYFAFLMLALVACAQNDLDDVKTAPGYEEIPFEFSLTTSSMEVFSKTDSEINAEPNTRTIVTADKRIKKTVKEEVTDKSSCIDVAIGADAQTRAAVAPTEDEKKITDICIFQFEGTVDGSKLIHAEYVGSASSSVNASLAASAATNAIYIVANVGDITSSFTVSTTTLANFKAAACDVTVNSAKGLPMIGCENVDMSKATSVSVSLKFMVAKLKFTCKNSMPATVGTFTYSTIQLKGVASQSKMEAATTAPADVISMGAASYTDATEVVWYVPENMSGTVDKLTTYQRGDHKAPAKAMYIEIKGQFKPAGADVDDAASAITYQVYLGANNTTDFNVARNKQYTITADIKGINATDNRIVIGEDLSKNGTEVANCYIALKKNYWYRFYGKVQGNGRGLEPWVAKYTVDDFTPTVDLKQVPGRALNAVALNPTEAFVIWQTTDTENSGGNVVASAFWSDRGYVVFRTGSDVEGNAVIGVRESATALDAVAWSWHIWKTANDPRTSTDDFKVRNNTTGAFDEVLAPLTPWKTRYEKSMKRNLGAANNKEKDPLAGGLLYQWGRKDPFIGSKDFAAKSTTPYPTVVHRADFKWKDGSDHGGATTAKKPSDVDAGGGEIIEKYAIAHPTHFLIQYNTTTYDWYAATREGQNDNLWGNPNRTAAPTASQLPNQERGIKSIYDPCPYGWRVAPQDTWTSFTKTNATDKGGNNYGSDKWQTWNVVGNEKPAETNLAAVQQKFTDNVGWTFYYDGDNSTGKTVYFPASGYHYRETGAFGGIGASGYGWSSSSRGSGSIYGSNLGMSSPWVSPLDGSGRGNGCPVRCVQE